MVDLAACVTDTSRLGCQMRFTKAMDGIVLQVPPETHDLH